MYLGVICSQSDELRLCQVDCLEENLFHVRGMRLGRRPWLSLGQILEMFLYVFDMKYYVVCNPRVFDIDHVPVVSKVGYTICMCDIELLDIQQSLYIRNLH